MTSTAHYQIGRSRYFSNPRHVNGADDVQFQLYSRFQEYLRLVSESYRPQPQTSCTKLIYWN